MRFGTQDGGLLNSASNGVLGNSAMMKIGILCLGLIIALPALAREVETVLIVSIDALHPDALTEKTSPTLHALMRSGRYTLEGKSVDPTITKFCSYPAKPGTATPNTSSMPSSRSASCAETAVDFKSSQVVGISIS